MAQRGKAALKFKGIRKTGDGTHIFRYDLDYIAEDGRNKKYEIVSRDPNITRLEELQNWHSKTVTLICISTDNTRILLSREYRIAVGDWIYNFPSGIIDPGELPTQAAARELKEETGLTLVKRIVRLRSSYNAPGLTNETTSVVIGLADGEIGKSTSSFEEIRARWFTKDEVRQILKKQKMSARAQLFCFTWAYGDMSIEKLAEESDDYDEGHLW